MQARPLFICPNSCFSTNEKSSVLSCRLFMNNQIAGLFLGLFLKTHFSALQKH